MTPIAARSDAGRGGRRLNDRATPEPENQSDRDGDDASMSAVASMPPGGDGPTFDAHEEIRRLTGLIGETVERCAAARRRLEENQELLRAELKALVDTAKVQLAELDERHRAQVDAIRRQAAADGALLVEQALSGGASVSADAAVDVGTGARD
jgi:hypothetical protein